MDPLFEIDVIPTKSRYVDEAAAKQRSSHREAAFQEGQLHCQIVVLVGNSVLYELHELHELHDLHELHELHLCR